MKLSFKDKVKLSSSSYWKDVKDELKNNSIVLSFAICIIFIGIISIFHTSNNHSLLIGIAISSFLLTIIQCFCNGNTILNILPVFTMLLFGFFEKTISSIPVIKGLLDPNHTNFIIFIAFSFSFLIQAYKNIVFKHKVRELNQESNKCQNKMIQSQLAIIKNVQGKTNKIKKLLDGKNGNDKEIRSTVNDLLEYVESESFVSNVKSSLIQKGNEEEKNNYSIEEVEESIILNSGLIRNREINAVKSES